MFGIEGVWGDVARIAVIVGVAYLLVLWVAALVWIYRDIASRTRDVFSQTVALVLVLAFNLPGLLLYLILRPKDTMADQYDRQLEAEALLHEIQEQSTCPACRRKIETEFVACPYCRTSLRVPCDSCGKALATTWVLCPYCATPRTGFSASRREPAAVAATAVAEPDPPPASAPTARRPRPASTATYTPPAAKAAPTDTADL
jgi:hypothetical protein